MKNFGILSLALGLAAMGLAAMVCLRAQADDKSVRPWALAYVMSYDNDLSRFADGILAELAAGSKAGGVPVSVLVDVTGDEGLRHVHIDGGVVRSDRLATENSASADGIEAFLHRSVERFPSRRLAIVFLNHGGALDEMNLDVHPGPGNAAPDGRVEGEAEELGGATEPAWLSAREMGERLRKLEAAIEPDIELVFLQQCGRASIENLYNFRGIAPAVLASQTVLQAPNTYYRRTLEWLGENPEARGAGLASRIIDTDEHYTSYVSVDGAKLGELPARIDPILEALAGSKGGRMPDPTLTERCFGPRRGESLNDLFTWLRAVSDARGVAPDHASAVAGFERWATSELIVRHGRHPDQLYASRNWCGLGVYVPLTDEARQKYRDYPLYRDSRLDELWKP